MRSRLEGLLEQPVELIIVEPVETDLALIETVAGAVGFSLRSVVAPPEEMVGWFKSRGAERSAAIAGVSRLLPGALVVYLGKGLPPADVMECAASHGLSVIDRESAVRLFSSEQASGVVTASTVVKRYRRLLDDYFPTSRNSSTSVKLAACLTEVISLWHPDGGAVLLGAPGAKTLAMGAEKGAGLPRDAVIEIGQGTVLDRCFNRGKHELETGADVEILPGVHCSSAACIPIKSGSGNRGALVVWSGNAAAFGPDDLAGLSLFSHYIATLLDVDELGEKIAENLITDPTTGLHNRRQFDTKLAQEISRAKRYTLNVSLVVFDIDNLEEYNVACGHLLGNLALSDIAAILYKGTREVDFVSRIGGDEFALILPETNRLGALKLADRLREEIASYPFPVPEDGASVNLTVSAGIANFPHTGSPSEDLFPKALQALEEAKKQGPDTIRLWEP